MFSRPSSKTVLLAVALAAFLGLLGGAALAADLQEELDTKVDKLDQVEERQGVLTSELERMGNQISRLQIEVTNLRDAEAAVEAELAAKQAELDTAEADLESAVDHLDVVRDRLKRALVALRERLIAIYEAGSPDLASIVLGSEDLSDAASRAEYVTRIQEHDDALVDRVGELRDEAQSNVERQRELRDQIASARDQIAAHEAELQSTRVSLESQQGELISARGARKQTLAKLDERAETLEGDVSSLQAEIQSQLGGLPSGSYPAGPTAPGTFIFPVSGTVTSPFGYRWGRMHEGIDIGAAEGTPIWAADDGTVVLQQSEAESGGYGNYTCLDHGGGLATCYAHQSAFNVSPGDSVSQGEVIGLVGNTGNSFGAHLHFEVRINGVAYDPMGYL
ncbi:MAG TPA: peptidoglycan DD-metalloendopeptidase family protein [Solirubrobacterales bacterium]|nr:peptidoglycan DD-metalloendopeptidase family protein [Solirubrobacterales bacterium]